MAKKKHSKLPRRILNTLAAIMLLSYMCLQSRISFVGLSQQQELVPYEPIFTKTHRVVSLDWSWTPAIVSSALPPLHQEDWRTAPDYGTVHNNITRAHRRTIPKDDNKLQHDQRDTFLSQIDKEVAAYYDPYEDRDFYSYVCRPPKWKYDMYPVCNILHELTLERLPDNQEFNVEYLTYGLYREVYRFQGRTQQFVLKTLRPTNNFRFDIVSTWYIRGEAMILEKLSASPRLANLYGYCSFTTLTQIGVGFADTVVPLPNWQFRRMEPRPPSLPPLPNNRLTPHAKLKLAIEMAEGLAELHGFPLGPVCHDDLSLNQWLLNENGQAFLNDVNNIRVLEWKDDEKEYCPYFTILQVGDSRPAEAYSPNRTSTESDDIWSFGNILFSLLTGVEPWIEKANERDAREAILRGDVPVVPTPPPPPLMMNSSRIERRLMEIVRLCHQPRPEDRATIFTVLQRLRDVWHDENL